jgi:hypothetical protein
MCHTNTCVGLDESGDRRWRRQHRHHGRVICGLPFCAVSVKVLGRSDGRRPGTWTQWNNTKHNMQIKH